MARRRALAAYDAKRDFTRTPEPKGGGETAGNSFVVQKHWARRTHYDFRIELDGVLLSWAVTKTPSLDPAVKRLAVRTENHPIAYGGFEGLIPTGEYGGGAVMIWDRGTWAPQGDPHEGLEKGSLKVELNGERMKGGWALVRLKQEATRENWLLIKEKDELAAPDDADAFEALETSAATGRTRAEIEAGAPPKRESASTVDPRAEAKASSAFIPPMLCETRDSPLEGDDWLHELKYDGYRLQAHCAGREVCLFTREGHDWTKRFPAVERGLQKLDLHAVLDGEAVVFDENGLSSFAKLVASLETGGRHVFYVAFDILREGGRDLRTLLLTERKARLEAALPKVDGAAVRVSPWFLGGGPEIFAKVAAAGGEGIISKKAASAYKSGRSPQWVKVKAVARADVVIVGYSPSEKRPLASLLAAVEEGGRLRYAGRIGTGYTADTLARLRAALDPIRRDGPPEMDIAVKPHPQPVWVEPRHRAEVAFTGWTGDGQLRHARYLGLREDTAPPKPRRASVAKAAPEPAAPALLRRITHGERVMFPKTGMTKLQVAEYYLGAAPLIAPHLDGRPVSFLRAPEGLGEETFFQRHILLGMKRGVGRAPDPAGTHKDYITLVGEEGLITAAQFGVIELHAWGARLPNLNCPDRVVFDLDPDESLPFSTVRAAAFELRDVLASLDLKSFAMATGGKGVHVIAPLSGEQSWDVIEAFASGVARGLAKAAPERYVAVMSKAKRGGKIFIDWLRNQRSATAIMPWSLRARDTATIAAPVTWESLKALKNAATPQSLAQGPDPWTGFFELKQSLSKAAIDYLRRYATEK
ncbi:MAG: DNA ligase D [Hyphomicrobiales bacterium]|nr:DNA ligase D [Hyphomicrobiales bacterium]